MGKKKRHGRRSAFSNLKRKVGGLIGTGVQLLGLSHGIIRGALPLDSNSPARVVQFYSGYDMNTGTWNQDLAVQSGTIIGVTYLIGYGIKWVARH